MAVDLAISLSNPFSPFRKRIIFYHIFCWGIAGLLASLVSIIPNVAGLWVVNPDISSSYLCWLKSESSYSDYQPWVFLYIPIIVIYSYALYVLLCAQNILKKGIPVTFLHRIRTLDTSKNMLTVFSLYYGCVVGLGILSNTVKYFWPALSFTFSTKSFLSLIVFWMMENSNKLEQTPSTENDSGKITTAEPVSSDLLGHTTSLIDQQIQSENQSSILYDLNYALQQEVVTYATVGIQQCAVLASHDSHHSIPDIKAALPRNNNAFPRTITNTTNRSQHYILDEYYSLQFQIPQDLFLIDNDRFRSLAQGTMNDLQNALKASSQLMNVAALKSTLQTRFIHHEYSDDEWTYDSESDRRSAVAQPTRPTSWNFSNYQRNSGKSEEKDSKLTEELMEQELPERTSKNLSHENSTVLPLNQANLLSQMKLHVKPLVQVSDRRSETIPRRHTMPTFLQSMKDYFGSLFLL